MTEDEVQILETLVKAHNIFTSLDQYHPDDAHEWGQHLHGLQNIIMSRVAVRSDPVLFGLDPAQLG